jgi:hypothetical protein
MNNTEGTKGIYKEEIYNEDIINDSSDNNS